MEQLESRRLLATYTVDDVGDGINPLPNRMTLREAIIAANANPGHDEIKFSYLAFGNTGGLIIQSEMVITDDLTINGAYTDLNGNVLIKTLDAGGGPTSAPGDGSRIFNIESSGPQITVRLENLILTGGDIGGSGAGSIGGAIRNLENLVIHNSTIAGNSANLGGAILNEATLTVTNSTISDNRADTGSPYYTPRNSGGGIANFGTATITGSTFSGNHALVLGGGLANFGSATVDSSTFHNNSSASYGGGVLNDNGSLTITRSTLSGNAASVNGGGLSNFGPATITNTIIANSSGRPDVEGGGSFSGDYNLIESSGGPQTGAIASIAVVNSDPLLGPLADNGGPTLTHALLPGSPAVNAGDPAITGGTDQSGNDRVRLGRVDIGAFELQTTFPSQGLIVSTTDDVVDGDFTPGDLSLREAIAIANEVTGANTITFSSLFDSTQTIDIGSQLPTVTDGLTIIGPGADLLTIDAGSTTTPLAGDGYGIFLINDSTTNLIDVSLSGLTLTGGDIPHAMGSGGAINNRENLTISESAFVANRARFGGAITTSPDSITTISSSLFTDNYASQNGGSISNSGELIATNVTFSGNDAVGVGGAIIQTTYPASPAATLELKQSTITGNTTGGGGSDGLFFFTSYGATSATLDNTIVNDGVAGVNGSVTLSGSYNLFRESNPGITGSNNQDNTDPLLGPLADNGGPTRTHALLPGSPAINAGDPSITSGTDQRGEDRVQMGRVDIGAFEIQTTGLPAGGLVVSTTDDVVDGDFSSGQLSLREALLFANDVSGTDTITFSSLFDSPQTIDIGSQLPTITDGVTITGPGDGLLTIDAGGGATTDGGDGYRILNIDDGTAARMDVRISGIKLTGGDPGSGDFSGYGGAIRNAEDLTLTRSTLSDNTSRIFGGGLYNDYGMLTVTDSTLSDNMATDGGGGIFNQGTAIVTSSTLFGNIAKFFGGGIANMGTAVVANNILSGNASQFYGGGIYNQATATVTSSTLSGNTSHHGGGIYNNGTVNVTNSTLSGNAAAGNGGGIHGAYGDLNVTNSTLSANTAGGDGGGIIGHFGTNVIRSTLWGNTAGRGGGIFARFSTVNVNSVIVAGSITGGTPGGDLGEEFNGDFSGSYNLIADGSGVLFPGLTNTISGDPLLGPLADNGGPTPTHALQSGSSALNAGDPAIVFDPNEFDQTGTPYVRVFGSRVDIGAFERQPRAIIGGTYTGDEGSSISLSGSASTSATVYEWDLDNDGQYDDATGENVNFLPNDNGVFTIGLRINGSGGPTDSTTVTIGNLVPSSGVTGPSSGVPFQPRTFTLTATDPSPVDQASDFIFDIDWNGDSIVDETVVGPSGTQIDHAFSSLGNKTVRVTATDKDGGTSNESTHPIHIVRVEMQGGDLVWGGTVGADAVEFEETFAQTVQIRTTLLDGTVVADAQTFAGISGRVLAYSGDAADTIDAGGVDGLHTISATLIGGRGDDTITGGDAADTIRGDAEGDGSEGKDVIDGGGGDDLIYGDGMEGAADTIMGGDGNDTIYGDNGDISADGAEGNDVIYGNDGNDLLFGGRKNDTIFGGDGNDLIDGEVGNDTLIGGVGNDTLIGGDGKDLLLAGAGADTLYGGAGEDLLVAGSTGFDSSEADLERIGNEWRSTGSYATRIANISGTPGGANDPTFLQPGSAMLNDAEIDTLFGQGDQDWFLYDLTGLIPDILSDLQAGEVETDIA